MKSVDFISKIHLYISGLGTTWEDAMEDVKISSIVSYENWVKMLNKDTHKTESSKLKPKAPHSQANNPLFERRSKKITTSENWLG